MSIRRSRGAGAWTAVRDPHEVARGGKLGLPAAGELAVEPAAQELREHLADPRRLVETEPVEVGAGDLEPHVPELVQVACAAIRESGALQRQGEREQHPQRVVPLEQPPRLRGSLDAGEEASGAWGRPSPRPR